MAIDARKLKNGDKNEAKREASQKLQAAQDGIHLSERSFGFERCDADAKAGRVFAGQEAVEEETGEPGMKWFGVVL